MLPEMEYRTPWTHDGERARVEPEATYRKKGHQAYQGYVVNPTETCDPDNPFQPIVKVQTEPNTTEDTTLLEQGLPEIRARTNVHTLYNDAGFCGPNVDQVLHKLKVEQAPTSLRGIAPDPSRTSLADCEIQLDADRQPVKLICPHQYTATVTPGRKEGPFVARWTNGPCPECRSSNQHAGRKPSTTTFLRFSRVDLDRALRRQRMCTCHLGNRNLRAAVDAAVAALKRPFSNDQAPVRGRIRLSQMMIGSVAMVSIRRIRRYLQLKSKLNRAEHTDSAKVERSQRDTGLPASSFLPTIWARFQRWLLLISPVRAAPVFGSQGFFRGVIAWIAEISCNIRCRPVPVRRLWIWAAERTSISVTPLSKSWGALHHLDVLHNRPVMDRTYDVSGIAVESDCGLFKPIAMTALIRAREA